MMRYKVIPLVKGFVKNVLLNRFTSSSVNGGGSTINSRYCYSVWMRHLHFLSKVEKNIPEKVVDFGPGLTLGVGLAALLSGCQKVYAIDSVKYWSVEENLKVFDDLVELFRNNARIPDDQEFQKVNPEIGSYEFPKEFLDKNLLNEALDKSRLNAIRDEIKNVENYSNKYILFCRYNKKQLIDKDLCVDFLFSQAVLQHVEELDIAYNDMNNWVRPGGHISHTIDFKSFGTSKLWNGHWTYTDREWKIVRGKKFIINRFPLSEHLKYLVENNFQISERILYELPSKIKIKSLAKKFRKMKDEDLRTCGIYYLAFKKK